jgi:hypothetical protein
MNADAPSYGDRRTSPHAVKVMLPTHGATIASTSG